MLLNKIPALIEAEAAVANFFKPTSEKEKEPEKVSWKIIDDSLLIGKYQLSEARKDVTQRLGKRKVAAFDFVSDAISHAGCIAF